FFFFQAEDGIRDLYVTGVQTCALPICQITEVGASVLEFRPGDRIVTMMQGLGGVRAERPGGYAEYVVVRAAAAAPLATIDPLDRSEERRVGKECKTGWGPSQQ